MSDLVVIGFNDEHTAFEMRAALAKMQKEYLIDMEDIVVVTRDDNGKVTLHQATNLTAAGAVGGHFLGNVDRDDLHESLAGRSGWGWKRRSRRFFFRHRRFR
jgi:hypothetical protein